MFADGERAPVGADGGAQDGGAVRADDADRGRAAEQRGEQVAARLDACRRAPRPGAPAAASGRAGLDQRAGAEPLRVGRGRLRRARCRAARARRRRRSRRARAARRRRASTARSRRCERSLAARLASRNARSVALRSASWSADPVERRGQPRAAVELARVAAARVPLACGAAELVVQVAALGVLLEPAAQARPLAQQRLVRDLDLALADRDAAGRRRARRARRPRRRRSSSSERDAAAHDRVALALARQPQQDPPRDLPRCSGSSRS